MMWSTWHQPPSCSCRARWRGWWPRCCCVIGCYCCCWPWRDKAIALTETLQFFLRSDPFPPVTALFWVNLVVVLAFGGIVASQFDVRAIRTAVSTRPVLWLSGALAVVALVLPISTVNDLIKPDERFVAPALLLAIAALPYHAVRRPAAAPGPVLAAAVIALHLVEYVNVGARIAGVDAAIDATVPDDTSVLNVTVSASGDILPAVDRGQTPEAIAHRETHSCGARSESLPKPPGRMKPLRARAPVLPLRVVAGMRLVNNGGG